MPRSAFEPRAKVFAGAAARAPADHLAPELQRALAALHDDDVHDRVVLLGRAIRIAIQQPEPVMSVIGECFARGVIGADLRRQRGVAFGQFGGAPQAELRLLGRQWRRDDKSRDDDPEGRVHGSSLGQIA